MKTSARFFSVAAASVMAVTVLSSECIAATQKAVFDKISYCIIDGSYKNGKAVISWKKFKGASQYHIYRSTDNGPYKMIAKTKNLSYTDRKCKKGSTYSYKVYAVKGSTKSAVSEYLYVGIDDDGEAEVYIYDVPKDYEPKKQQEYNGGYDDDWCYSEEVCEEEEAICEEPAYDDADYEECVDDCVGADSEIEDNIYYYNGNQNDIKAGTLTAGKLIDNSTYSTFMKTMKSNDWSELVGKWTIDTAGRYIVKVTDGQKPVENAKVKLTDADGKTIYTAVTDNKGIAYVFTKLSEETADSVKIVSPDGTQTETKKLSEARGGSINVTLKKTAAKEKTLDLMFLVDTTGSMSDELLYLEKEMEDVINRVSSDNNNIKIRVSVDFYRDTGDLYKVRSFPFRERISTVQRSLAAQNANGGGDYPEAVHTALNVAVNKVSWNSDSTKIMFMVLDAPAHDTQDVIEDYKKRVLQASAKGIRIVPVVSSGTDTETEYLMRTAAVITGGQYLFLTDNSGVGLGHKKPDASVYEVKKLNDLMVEIIDSYLD